MATNYYLHCNPCPHCGKADDILHIGQHAFGWAFALHVIPEKGLNSLEDWKKAIQEGIKIMDDEGRGVDKDRLLGIIQERSGSWDRRRPLGYASEDDFHLLNGSMRGPNGLLRRRIDGSHCIGHGDGPWDLIAGEFS